MSVVRCSNPECGKVLPGIVCDHKVGNLRVTTVGVHVYPERTGALFWRRNGRVVVACSEACKKKIDESEQGG
jgi:hypothetical protein